jgi:hypothetical protein
MRTRIGKSFWSSFMFAFIFMNENQELEWIEPGSNLLELLNISMLLMSLVLNDLLLRNFTH